MTNPKTPSPNWSRPLRLIHPLLAIVVTLQLFPGLVGMMFFGSAQG